jgi:hypothetical protein
MSGSITINASQRPLSLVLAYKTPNTTVHPERVPAAGEFHQALHAQSKSQVFPPDIITLKGMVA